MHYADDQFRWRQLSEDNVTVHWTGSEVNVGQTALDIVAESLPRIQTIIPVDEMAPLQIYIYPSAADLRSALRLTGRDWVGAHASPELGVILVTAVNSRTAAVDLRQSIPHELTHFWLYQALGSSYTAVPAWFNEGLATLLEGQLDPAYAPVLAQAVADRRTIPMVDLCHFFPTRDEDALLAYAQSADFVRYLRLNYGTQALTGMIAAFADGADCETAFTRTMSRSLSELEAEWLASMQPQPRYLQFLSQHGIWLLLLLFGMLTSSLLMLTPKS